MIIIVLKAVANKQRKAYITHHLHTNAFPSGVLHKELYACQPSFHLPSILPEMWSVHFMTFIIKHTIQISIMHADTFSYQSRMNIIIVLPKLMT